MSLAISIKKLSIEDFPNGDSNLDIDFEINSILISSINAILVFQISPFPELNIKGNKAVTSPYIVQSGSNVFTKSLVITNKSDIENRQKPWPFGVLDVSTIDPVTKQPTGDMASISYQ